MAWCVGGYLERIVEASLAQNFPSKTAMEEERLREQELKKLSGEREELDCLIDACH